MTYPISTDVTSGQPTAAAHYNNLRADSLRFGQSIPDAVNIGELFARYEDNFNLVALDTNRVRVEASPTSPVALVIEGCPLRTITNVDLPILSAPSGSAATWFIFAMRSASSTSFTLTANTSPTEYTNARRVGSCYWDGAQIVPGSIVTAYRSYLVNLLQYAPPQACQGRLTLTSGVPILTADATAGTLYFSPFTGCSIDLYSPGHAWVPHAFSELSLSFSGLPSGSQYDIFAHYNAGSVTLERSPWSNPTTRANAIVLQDGRWVLSSAKEYLLLGTVRLSAAGQIAHTLTQRFIANVYNTRPFPLFKGLSATYTYNSAAIRQANADPSILIEAVFPTPWHFIDVFTNVNARLIGSSFISHIGVDSAAADSASSSQRLYNADNANLLEGPLSAHLFAFYPSPGYHFFALLESSSSTGTTTILSTEDRRNCIGATYHA